MTNIKRILAVISAAALCLSLASCESKEEGNNLVGTTNADNLKEDEMPYGATLTELKPASDQNLKIITEYDHRYLEKEEVYLVADYLYALSVKDADLISKTFHKDSIDYIINYSTAESLEDYMNVTYDSLCSMLGEDFEFTYIDITEFSNTESDPDIFEAADLRLTSENLGKVTSKKCVTLGGVTMYALADGSDKLLDNALTTPISVCIYQIDGKYYIV